MKTKVIIIILLLVQTYALALGEFEKIQLLLSEIERSNLIFIRDGKEYSAIKAKKHLENKLKNAKKFVNVNTADKFIRIIATKSYLTRRLYYVKYPDGKIMELAIWLKHRLKEIESKE